MMRVAWLLVPALLLAASCLSPAENDAPAVERKESVNDLLLEVDALQTFRLLGLTREQLTQLRVTAKETVQQLPAKPVEAKVSDELYQALRQLRNALVANNDEERIDDLGERLAQLRQKADEPLGEDFEMTEAAREQAPKLLKTLAPGQVAGFIASLTEEVADPAGELVAALVHVRTLNDKEWKLYRESLSDEIGRLVAGLNSEKATECGDKVVQLLITARSLSEEDFQRRQPELEKKARAIVGDVGPLDVLRHEVEYRLAELLSNPRLDAALSARLK